MKKYSSYIAFTGLMIFILFLRLWRLSELPLGLHIDEAGMGLNAWSIANYGCDRHGNFLPVLPLNFYSEQSAFYTYFCALLVKCFGLSAYTLRLPGVVMGVVAVLSGALIMRERWGRRGFFTGLILLGIFPYYIMNCRFALDCNTMLGMLTAALYALLRLMKRAEREPGRRLYGYFAAVGVLFGLVLYTYIIAAVAVAVFFVLFGLSWLFCDRERWAVRLRQLCMLAIPLTVMAIPLAMAFCVNYFDLEPVVTPFFTAPKMFINRTEEVGFSLAELPLKLRRLLHVFTSDGVYGSSDRYWTMYWWSVPFAVFGGFCSLRAAVLDLRGPRVGIDACMIFLSAAETVLFLLCGRYTYHINGIFIALSYFCVNGIFTCLGALRERGVRISAAAVLASLYAISFGGFALEYYGADQEQAYQVFGGAAEAISLLDDTQRQGEIYVLDEVGEIYFLSHPIPPAEFSAVCDEIGYIRDYGGLHFYLPESCGEGDIFVCNKSAGTYNFLAGGGLMGYDYSVLETEHYAVFLRKF